jgi:MFS family permease
MSALASPPGNGTETAQSTADVPVPAVTPMPAPVISLAKAIALILIGALGMYVMQLTLTTALSLRIATIDPVGKDVSYSLAVSVSSLVLLLSIPLSGALSDRTTGRFGRRRPWILGGLLVALAATAVIGTVESVPVIAGAYIVAAVGVNAAFNAFAVIPVEALPDRMRARVMGLMGMFGALAMSLGSYLAAGLVGNQLLMMTAPVLLAVVLIIPLLLFYREPRLDRDQLPEFNVRAMARNFVVNPRKYPNFGWTWLSRFLAGIAMTALFSYFIFFMVDRLNMPIFEAGASAGLLTLISAPVSVVFFSVTGYISDKVGRRKPFIVVSTLLMAAALFLAATAGTFTTFVIAWLLFAMGQAIFLTVDLALCAAVLPNAADAGKDMAVFGLALSIPNILVPAVAPALLGVGDGHNYAILWGVAGALCALGSVVIRRVRGVR